MVSQHGACCFGKSEASVQSLNLYWTLSGVNRFWNIIPRCSRSIFVAEIRLASCTRGEALIFVLLTKPFFWVTYVKLLLIFTGASENRNYLILMAIFAPSWYLVVNVRSIVVFVRPDVWICLLCFCWLHGYLRAMMSHWWLRNFSLSHTQVCA